MAATSFVRDRGRAIGIVAALALTAALVTAPAAIGAVDGDPIARSWFNVKLSKAFKKQLRSNGVKMKPRTLKLRGSNAGDVDPTTGQADLRFKSMTFKLKKPAQRKCERRADNKRQARRCKRGIRYNKLSGSLPGNVKGSDGKLFKLSPITALARNGFGAEMTGAKVTFLKAAAKRINRQFNLDSLRQVTVGELRMQYVPETLKIIGGTAQTTGLITATPPFSVGVKLLNHCVSGLGNGITPIAPAEKSGVQFTFPVIDGEISPDATMGESITTGGLRLMKSENAMDCATAPQSELTQEKITTSITARTVSSTVNILSSPCPPGFACSAGLKGNAVGQTLDPTNTVITIDPATRTFTLDGTIVKLAETSATTLNEVFPCVENAGALINGSCDPNAADTAILKGGDVFGTSKLTVVAR